MTDPLDDAPEPANLRFLRRLVTVLTAVMMPEGHSADAFRKATLERCDLSLGNGLSKVADRVFRIGHLGDFNDLIGVEARYKQDARYGA